MTDRTVSVKLRADVEQFKKSMADAGQSVDKTTQKTSQQVATQKQAVQYLGRGLVVAGGAMTAFAALAVKKFADFDQAMSNVAATGAEAKASIDNLRTAAIDAGKATVYSASEAAAAEESLAKAGLSAKDILGGGLTGALNLAAAGALGVADAADITSVALNQFKLGGDKASHVADLLAAGAGKAMGDVSDLGQALKQGGTVASQTGLSIEETTAALSAFASKGLLGADAGTSFKSMLQRLTPQSKEAQQEFDRLGISAYDAQGNFVGLANFAGQLRDKMSGLTPEARNAALSVMFGSDAVRAASILYDEGAQGIQQWTTAVDDSGYAAQVAATRLDNLKGDWEQLSGSVETALIKMGEGANGPLRSLTQDLTGLVNGFANAPSSVQNLTLAIVGGGGLVLLGTAGIAKLVVSIHETQVAVEALTGRTITLKGAMVGLGTAAVVAGTAAAADALGSWIGKTSAATVQTDALTRSLVDLGKGSNDAGAFGDVLTTTAMKANKVDLSKASAALDAFALSARKALGTSITDTLGRWQDFGGREAAFAKQAGQIDAALANLVKSGNADEAAATFKRLSDAAAGMGVPVDSLTKSFPQYEAAIKSAATTTDTAAAATDASASAVDTYSAAQQAGTATTQDYVAALKELVDSQNTLAGNALSERDAERALQAAIDDAATSLKEHGQNLDIDTEKGRANQAAMDAVAKSGWDVITSMQANGATSEELQAKMASIREAFIKVAESEGNSADQANALADQLGLLPSNVSIKVAADTSAAKAAIDRFLAGYQNAQVRVAVKGSGGITMAGGGPVYGPGTGTSDSIPARLSNGEYVVKASAVAQYGTRFLDNVNAQRFAKGGYVGPAAPSTAPAETPGFALTVGQLVAADPRAATSELVRSLRFEMAGRLR